MSPSNVCQGLQPYREASRLIETRVLRLELATTARKPFVTTDSGCDVKSIHKKGNNNNSSSKVDMGGGGWSFLLSLSNDIVTSQNTKNEKIYTPPSIKRSSSVLSEKSLKMCTESLGSETGSDINWEVNTTNHDQMAFLSVENKNINYNETTNQDRSRTPTGARMMSRSETFPPPLTSISGSTSVQVRPHREEGRLVLQAVRVPSCHSYFHAERSNGRLRLHLVEHCCTDGTGPEEEQEEEECICGEEEEEEEEEECICGEEEEEEEEEYICGEEEEEEEEYGEIYDYGGGDDDLGEDLEGNSGNVGGEMGNLVKNLQRPSRCKEGGDDSGGGSGNKALLNWEQLWVAT